MRLRNLACSKFSLEKSQHSHESSQPRSCGYIAQSPTLPTRPKTLQTGPKVQPNDFSLSRLFVQPAHPTENTTTNHHTKSQAFHAASETCDAFAPAHETIFKYRSRPDGRYLKSINSNRNKTSQIDPAPMFRKREPNTTANKAPTDARKA